MMVDTCLCGRNVHTYGVLVVIVFCLYWVTENIYRMVYDFNLDERFTSLSHTVLFGTKRGKKRLCHDIFGVNYQYMGLSLHMRGFLVVHASGLD